MATQRKKKTIIHSGSYSEAYSDVNVKGLNLQKAVVNKLIEEGCLATSNSLDYYPTLPILSVADITAPTEAEMKNVPVGAQFQTTNGTTYYLWIKVSTTAASEIHHNT